VDGAGRPVTTSPAVLARGLGKRYPGTGDDGVWALRDVSVEVPKGGGLAIVGENGSGKSTLLDLLIGVSRPSAGTLEVAGPTASLLELGAGFFLELTGRENAVQMGLLAGLSRGEAKTRAEAVRGFAEIGEFFDRPVRTYSAGMAMRLGFAIASSLDAPVTVIDEVLAVGDGYFQRRCIDRLQEMRASGSTLVVASHDLHALRGLCDRAVWLRQGRVEAEGPCDQVVGRYEEHLRQRSARDAAARGRHGTGEVLIHKVVLADATGTERSEFRAGETLRVEVEFETTKPLDSPVMGVALFRDDGVCCYGSNTRADGLPGRTYEGRFRLVAEFPDLALLTGGYEASVAFYDKDHVYAYAWDHRLYPLRVVADRPGRGLVFLPHRFSVERVDA
jgi:ABC-type polysaccharide/polyol phosphate transport system ATPase subunit